ncbi:potassium-transporting ATPase subunit B, partial [Streptomyces niveus]
MSTATSTPTPDPDPDSGPSRAPHSDVPTSHRPGDGDGRVGGGLFDPKQLVKSLPDAIRKLDPRVMVKSPVMFVV